ncbi:spore germination protein GerPB [Bacillus carboniphilus]|uniref:Spore germination protein GerPB n=1 Tax=Bacillus carboniphilus TaxID=86663 RepID=A0ABN0VQ29_9BACI
MKFYIQQSIYINVLRIGSISNSSVLQIGSSGSISSNAYLYNTGGYIGPAPEALGEAGAVGPVGELGGAQAGPPQADTSLVPLGTPTT